MERTIQGLKTASWFKREERIQIVHARREQFKDAIKQEMNKAIATAIPKINASLKKLELKKGTNLEVKWKFDFILNSKSCHDLIAYLVVFDETGKALHKSLAYILFRTVNLEAAIYSSKWEIMKKTQLNSQGIHFSLEDVIESDKAFEIKL